MFRASLTLWSVMSWMTHRVSCFHTNNAWVWGKDPAVQPQRPAFWTRGMQSWEWIPVPASSAPDGFWKNPWRQSMRSSLSLSRPCAASVQFILWILDENHSFKHTVSHSAVQKPLPPPLAVLQDRLGSDSTNWAHLLWHSLCSLGLNLPSLLPPQAGPLHLPFPLPGMSSDIPLLQFSAQMLLLIENHLTTPI